LKRVNRQAPATLYLPLFLELSPDRVISAY
jgi:hypothetical protein